MTNPILDVDRLSNEIREIDGDHTMGAGELAEKLSDAEVYTHMAEEVERMRESEISYLKHGYFLTGTLREISEYVDKLPDDPTAVHIRSILDDMWTNLTEKAPGRAQSLWGKLTRSEQEEYRDIHYEAVPGGEERAHELEDLARERLDGED